MCYFENLVWDGHSLARVDKPNGSRDFSHFDAYDQFLSSALDALVRNMRDPRRTAIYKLMGTLSSGYDSTMCAALMKPLGLEQVICFERSNMRDDGRANARVLGLTPIMVDLNRWSKCEMPEVPFIAGDGIAEEVHYRGAEEILVGTLLITGYHGDKVWERETPYTARTLIRGDMSGMSLTEYRLWVGFIHCPIAFFGARQVAEIKRISNSAEMQPWSVGGHYDRPICRRIIERAGLPRKAFGMTKGWASRWFVIQPEYLTDRSRRRFLTWLRGHRWRWIRLGRIPPLLSVQFDRWRLRALVAFSDRLIRVPGYERFRLWRFRWLKFLTHQESNLHELPLYGFRRYVLPWAVHQATQRYIAPDADSHANVDGGTSISGQQAPQPAEAAVKS
jgi:hypothetical protein